MIHPGFIGGSNTLLSIGEDRERTVNWVPELAAPGTGTQPAYLTNSPGLEYFVALGAGPVRGLFEINGRCFAVAGDHFYEIYPNQTYEFRGDITINDNQPVTMCSNGTAGFQVFIVSANHGFIFNLATNTFAQITDPDFPFPAKMGLFADGYFVCLKGQSRSFQISALEDGTDWDALDVFEISEASDNIQALVGGERGHRELWLIGNKTTEVWADIGDPLIPFQPIPGTLIQQGTCAPWSAVCLDNSVFWVGQNELGRGVVYRADGYRPDRQSTHAAELAFLDAPFLDDAVGWAYQQGGHSYYLLYVPSMKTTWCYDLATQSWHERARWNADLWDYEPHLGRCATQAFGKVLVGDRRSPGVYAFNVRQYFDDIVLTT